MQLPYKPIDAFEVKGIRFFCVSAWNGLEEWRDGQGRAMIVRRDMADGFAGAFSAMFLNDSSAQEKRLTIISAHPDLIAELRSGSSDA